MIRAPARPVPPRAALPGPHPGSRPVGLVSLDLVPRLVGLVSLDSAPQLVVSRGSDLAAWLLTLVVRSHLVASGPCHSHSSIQRVNRPGPTSSAMKLE